VIGIIWSSRLMMYCVMGPAHSTAKQKPPAMIPAASANCF